MVVRTTLAGLALLVSTVCGQADTDRSTVERQNVETVVRLFEEGWGARPGWEDVWKETMAPDFRYVFHSQPPQDGLAASIAFNRALFDGFPDLVVQVEEIVAEDEVVVARTRLTGVHEGPFLGVPASGAMVDVPDMTLFRFDNGKVVEQRYFTDLLAVMAAIGAVPSPVE